MCWFIVADKKRFRIHIIPTLLSAYLPEQMQIFFSISFMGLVFKQFEDMKARKAANLAKLLAHLIMNHQLNLNVLKVIDISPNDMSEASVIFLTILFSSIFDSY